MSSSKKHYRIVKKHYRIVRLQEGCAPKDEKETDVLLDGSACNSNQLGDSLIGHSGIRRFPTSYI